MLKGEQFQMGGGGDLCKEIPQFLFAVVTPLLKSECRHINCENVEQYYDLLKEVLDEFDLKNH